MATIANHLSKQDLKMLVAILQKIYTDHPNENKYGNIDASELIHQFEDFVDCSAVLQQAGFEYSEDGSRLIYNTQRDEEFEEVYACLLSMDLSDVSEQVHTEESKIDPDCISIIKSQAQKPSTLSLDLDQDEKRYSVTSPCDISQCLCLEIIGNVLTLYSTYLQQPSHSNDNGSVYQHVFEQIGNHYTAVDVLNDFNHLLSKHSDQFEYIYNALIKRVYNNKPCMLEQCQFMQRNQRDRKFVQCSSALYLNDNGFDIVSQQILDRIHCFYFHSFDVGYKLTKCQINEIANVFAINSIIKSKQNNYRNIKGLNRLNNKVNKFKIDETQCPHDKLEEYAYGQRFYYWRNFKDQHSAWEWYAHPEHRSLPLKLTPYDHDNWQIQNKYQDLKEELTMNEICTISQSQFKQILVKAQMHIQSNIVKSLRCERKGDAAVCYDRMAYGRLMALGHLISMMVYCNCDELQRKFSETFRKEDPNETNESLKQRHSNYYFLARSLRECVECFGMDHRGNKNITIFHGVNRHFYFSSVDAYINGPFSTTTELAAAAAFCGGDGMILELYIRPNSWSIENAEEKEDTYKPWRDAFKTYLDGSSDDKIYRLNCMDMSWISDFVNEQEIFCIGGLKRIQYKTIQDFALGVDYKAYIAALRALTRHIMSENIVTDHVDPTKAEVQMAFRLLSHELFKYQPTHSKAIEFEHFPDYIDWILHLQCLNVLGFEAERSSRGALNSVIHNLFTDDITDWIDLELFVTIFPNIKHITYNGEFKDDKWLTRPVIYQSVLEFIGKHKGTQLDRIWIEYNCKYNESVITNVSTWEDKFKKYSWSITIDAYVSQDPMDLIYCRPSLIMFEGFKK
eukprot:894547_1